MRRRKLCVLMMTALLLTGCGKDGGGGRAEEMALAIRTEYIAMTSCAASAQITADYGRRVYQYTVAASVKEGETLITVKEPELAAGVTARIGPEQDSRLEYEGLILETGPLDGGGLTAVSALPALLEGARSGFIADCTLEELDGRQTLRIRCAEPDQESGTGTETTLWFDADSHGLLRGEISVDGYRVILCECTEFTMG